MPLAKIMWEEEREEFRREVREEEQKKAALKLVRQKEEAALKLVHQKEKAVLNMLQEKIDVETICRCMNLTAQEVEELKKRCVIS